MDSDRFIEQMRDHANLRLAFQYAINDRKHNDSYHDPLEIEHATAHEEMILESAHSCLVDPAQFQPNPAYSYFYPKSELCYRRMIYLPIRDLTIRYAMALVLAQHVDEKLAVTCFGNRRARGDHAAKNFLYPYAEVSWPAFCNWQESQSECSQVLIRTDISSFYDSIGHQYLLESISSELGTDMDAPIIHLLRRLLVVPVLSYSHASTADNVCESVRQGLVVGSAGEGFIANLYLRAVDEQMLSAGFRYGRYNDDIRIFAESRPEALRAILVLQQALLAKGLNLNSSKTAIAEGDVEIANLRSYGGNSSDYALGDDLDAGDADDPFNLPNAVAEAIDRGFNEPCRHFSSDSVLTSDKDAKEFCRFLRMNAGESSSRRGLRARTVRHVAMLVEILTRWHGATRHAAWLLVETATYRDICQEVSAAAQASVLEVLGPGTVSNYGQYRVLHFLYRPTARDGRIKRPIDKFTEERRAAIAELLAEYVRARAFELNMIAIYSLRSEGRSVAEIVKLIESRNDASQPLPIRTAIAVLEQLEPLQPR